MKSQWVTNILLGVIAASLALPPIAGFVNRQFIEPWQREKRSQKEESERRERCKKDPVDFGVVSVDDGGDYPISMSLPREVGVMNCILMISPSVDQVDPRELTPYQW